MIRVMIVESTKKEQRHCCWIMEKLLNDSKNPIIYNCIFREYGLKLIGSTSIDRIYICPWCGTKLPESLRDKLFNILEQEYGMNKRFAELYNKNLPQEFKSDEWWKKRGL